MFVDPNTASVTPNYYTVFTIDVAANHSFKVVSNQMEVLNKMIQKQDISIDDTDFDPLYRISSDRSDWIKDIFTQEVRQQFIQLQEQKAFKGVLELINGQLKYRQNHLINTDRYRKQILPVIQACLALAENVEKANEKANSIVKDPTVINQ